MKAFPVDENGLAEARRTFIDKAGVAGVARDRSGGVTILLERPDDEIERAIGDWAREKHFQVAVRVVGKIEARSAS